MRRIIFSMVACFIALQSTVAGATINPAETSITCDDVGVHTARLYQTLLGRPGDLEGLGYWVAQQRKGMDLEGVAYWMTQSIEFERRYGTLDDATYIHALYHNILDRPADPVGHAYWMGQLPTLGRPGVAVWMTLSEELAALRPFDRSPICETAAAHGLSEVLPGIAVGRSGSTITVVADRSLVTYRAVNGRRTAASQIAGDIVVNANWFTGSGAQAPVVVDGIRSGSADIIERGQLISYKDGCDGHGPDELAHIWMGELYTPGPCVETAVSGISIVHKGVRADQYPGIDLTYGYTNTNPAHTFIGYSDTSIVIIATRQMNARSLANHALALGVTEGIMLDGGGSTQIETPTHRLTTSRPVPTFAVLDGLGG